MIRYLLAVALLCVLATPTLACDAMRPCYGDGQPLYGPIEHQPKLLKSHRYSRKSARLGTTHRDTVQARHKSAGGAGLAGAIRTMGPGLAKVMAEGAGRIVSHPSGCPARAFCGCGASVRIFGRSIRSLWLAANWFRFPRTSPAPGTVAVRKHHVFVLERHVGGSTWIVFDANSGGHRTRVHARSIAGFVIVDPRGA